ncbi:hypothetical protein C6P46_005333 [Rhodotorula mucilaginosa]|uniref:Peptidase S59 domain-containing protein n=1 Tax=Rhodotorula mucilaginosa TaxID=5537 RepID=A0A9P7B4M0_RHOMI|nr:hypothetical protein C6P46_005333 [Rhodotorula mucilaginosa]
MFGASGSFGGFGQQQQQQPQQQQQQQPAGGGLFGGAATGGAFGSTTFGGAQSTPAFGQPAQQTSTFGGGFGSAAPAAPAFGAPAAATPSFGQPAAGGGLFGAGNTANTGSTGFSFGGTGGATSTFGQPAAASTGTTGGLFGAPKPATSTFGSFGQSAQQQQQQPAAGASAAPAFGAAAPTGPPNGTAVAPYQTTTVMEPPQEEGKPPPANQTAHHFQSITCMPQYKNYSFEELRYQDYQANRKTPTAGAAPTFGSAFGSSATPAFGAANTGTTGGGLFGAASSTPAFGAAQPASTGFGAAPATGGLFGSAGGATGGFGQPATSQPAAGGGLFGAATSQPQQTGGLFGSASTGNAFGQPAASSAPAFGGFGAAAAPKPATTGFSFGASTTTPASSGGLFGSTPATSAAPSNPFGQPAQPAATGGLFGSAQPAQQQQQQPAAGGFSFGSTANKPLFGAAAPATSAPAFGQPAAASTAPKPTFSFGATPAAGATTGGLFGSTQQQQPGATPGFGQQTSAAPSTGGLFGGTSTFGQQQQQQPAAGTNTFGGGLFGAKPAQPATGGGLFGQSTAPSLGGGGGLFGSTAQAQPQQQTSLFGSTQQPQLQQQQPGLGGSLFGSTNLGGQAGQPQPAAYASAEDANAYGSNPLFASVNPSPARPAEEKKKPPIFTAFRGTPVSRSSTKITRLRGFGSTSSASPAPGSPLTIGSGLGVSTTSSLVSPGTPNGRASSSPLKLVNGLSDEVALSPNAFVSRPSVKKLVIDKKTLGKSHLGNSSAVSDGGVATPGRARVTFNPEVEVPSRSSLFGTPARGVNNNGGGDENEASFALSEGGTGEGNTTIDSPSVGKSAAAAAASSSDWPARRPPATPAAPKHGDYFTSPSLDTLQKLPAAKLRAVPDLVVGRVGYGQVAFSQPVDLTTLPSVEELLGGLVRLEDRNATVYPDEYDDIKPPPGEGLNVPATITLENCFPLDKATRKPIKDKEHPRVQQHMKRLRNLEGTEFVDFEPETGKWTFEVAEF